MTANQRDVLLALNMKQMQGEDSMSVQENGVPTGAVARAAGRRIRSTAVILSQMREWGWVGSIHCSDRMGWVLLPKGVEALERDAGRVAA